MVEHTHTYTHIIPSVAPPAPSPPPPAMLPIILLALSTERSDDRQSELGDNKQPLTSAENQAVTSTKRPESNRGTRKRKVCVWCVRLVGVFREIENMMCMQCSTMRVTMFMKAGLPSMFPIFIPPSPGMPADKGQE